MHRQHPANSPQPHLDAEEAMPLGNSHTKRQTRARRDEPRRSGDTAFFCASKGHGVWDAAEKSLQSLQSLLRRPAQARPWVDPPKKGGGADGGTGAPPNLKRPLSDPSISPGAGKAAVWLAAQIPLPSKPLASHLGRLSPPLASHLFVGTSCPDHVARAAVATLQPGNPPPAHG
ncbi:hypothetical protein GGTG_12398 [Gaeumannomyces tritici R3-111a-1]|uniref:Uncharacterized protein n=1 Tax=Gaeumannomyces tritici (strain R3-111a-1) TaxID=644352 RepID=J3PFX3_GAET3|nr:hypothetical protein GGTG_12398 [Gaeumannomyces tritici R3-111a-1]EJT70225.1 hypothetical protein GGTG_12398 [Gaeumannomyces tritici R3-111a-1]